ncbi:serine/threonine-protein kinase [Haliangium sp.]|uniref:serine/threonine-protein kinase n=1 Tax=Haliangium sp. TaxID=2663208 RepID=UPI003D0F617F
MFRKGFARCPLDGGLLQEIAADPLEGAVFADRYVIEHCVGEGGMGRVYRATHRRMSRPFAVKVLFGEHAAEKEMQARFAREAEAACRLRHPNVVSVTDFGETARGLFYLVMDWVDGPRLTDIVCEQAPLPVARICDLTRQICLGLAHAHAQGLVHRDLKSENIVVDHEGGREVVRIIDFGLAVGVEADANARLTAEGTVYGTPAYMSPEQACGAPVDGRSDLYSLGVLVYEMLSGVLPFTGTPMDIVRQNLNSDPPPIAARVPDLAVEPALEAIARRLMAKRPQDRFQSADEVIAALDAIEGAAAGATAAAATTTTANRTHPRLDTVRVGRFRWLRWAIPALAAVAAGAALLLWRSGGTTESAGAESTLAPVPASLEPTAADDIELLGVDDDHDRGSEVVAARDQGAVEGGDDQGAVEDGGDQGSGDPGGDDRAAADDDQGSVEDSGDDRGSDPVATDRAADRRTRSTSRRRRRRATAATTTRTAAADETPPPAAPDPTPPSDDDDDSPGEISMAELGKLYAEVGALADRLAKDKGGGEATALNKAYFAVPFAASQANPALRPQVERQLRNLRRQMKRALRD